MLATVVKRGYAAARVSDLVKVSGVSSRSFYALFHSKEACFLATVEASLAALSSDSAERFAAAVVAQPGAARLCLIEAYAGGPEMLKRLDKTVGNVESRAMHLVRECPERVEMPAEMVSAYVGGIQEVARSRLRKGEESELPGLIEGLRGTLSAYLPPPEPLRLSARAPAPAAEDLDAPDHAERILRALAVVVAEEGYGGTTVEQIVKRAGISGSMFYTHFRDKEDAFLAAIDSAGAQAVAAIMPAYRRSPDWPRGVRGMLGAFFNFLASRPALANLLIVEVYGAGPAALTRREEVLRPLSLLLGEGGKRRQQTPPVVFEAIAGGILHLTYRKIRERGPAFVPGLAPLCTYIALAPFTGIEEACRAANAEGRSRGAGAPEPEAIRRVAEQPTRQRVLNIVSNGAATVAQIAREMGEPEAVIRQQLDELTAVRLVQSTGKSGPDEDGEEMYRSTLGAIGADHWNRIGQTERQMISTRIAEGLKADLDISLQTGTISARIDGVLARTPHLVDEQGWRELSDLQEETYAATVEIQARSTERLKAAGTGGIYARTLLALFEMPLEED